jgi:hypothetical protein
VEKSQQGNPATESPCTNSKDDHEQAPALHHAVTVGNPAPDREGVFMEKFNRAERRHQTARLKKARRWYGRGDSERLETGVWVRVPLSGKHLAKAVQYGSACSCYMCGNPRRKGAAYESQYTLQERRAMQRRLFSDLLDKLPK